MFPGARPSKSGPDGRGPDFTSHVPPLYQMPNYQLGPAPPDCGFPPLSSNQRSTTDEWSTKCDAFLQKLEAKPSESSVTNKSPSRSPSIIVSDSDLPESPNRPRQLKNKYGVVANSYDDDGSYYDFNQGVTPASFTSNDQFTTHFSHRFGNSDPMGQYNSNGRPHWSSIKMDELKRQRITLFPDDSMQSAVAPVPAFVQPCTPPPMVTHEAKNAASRQDRIRFSIGGGSNKSNVPLTKAAQLRAGDTQADRSVPSPINAALANVMKLIGLPSNQKQLPPPQPTPVVSNSDQQMETGILKLLSAVSAVPMSTSSAASSGSGAGIMGDASVESVLVKLLVEEKERLKNQEEESAKMIALLRQSVALRNEKGVAPVGATDIPWSSSSSASFPTNWNPHAAVGPSQIPRYRDSVADAPRSAGLLRAPPTGASNDQGMSVAITPAGPKRPPPHVPPDEGTTYRTHISTPLIKKRKLAPLIEYKPQSLVFPPARPKSTVMGLFAHVHEAHKKAKTVPPWTAEATKRSGK